MAGKESEVVIIGGGILGCSLAYELGNRGFEVTVVERGSVAREASWASAGIVALPKAKNMYPGQLELTRRGLEMYPDMVASLEEETGYSVDYVRSGNILITNDEDDVANLDEIGKWQMSLGYKVERLDARQVAEFDPVLSPDAKVGWFASDVGALSAHRLTLAFAAAARKRGAVIKEHCPVLGITVNGDRVTGVTTPEGELPARLVVVAAGAWSRFVVRSIGVELPTRPVKGQLIAFSAQSAPLSCVVHGYGGYAVPRADGTILVAATEEEVGFDRRVTGEGLQWLMELGGKLCPKVLKSEVVSMWTGLRPGSLYERPIMGPVPEYDGLWAATGHFRTGIKEGPPSAELIASSIASGTVAPTLEPFLPTNVREVSDHAPMP